MADTPFNLFSLLFGVLIIGFGYLGLYFVHRYFGQVKEFYNMKLFDKIIQTIIIGTASFILTVGVNFFNVDLLADELQTVQYLLNNPIIFMAQIVFVVIIAEFLITFKMVISNIEENRKKSQ